MCRVRRALAWRPCVSTCLTRLSSDPGPTMSAWFATNHQLSGLKRHSSKLYMKSTSKRFLIRLEWRSSRGCLNWVGRYASIFSSTWGVIFRLVWFLGKVAVFCKKQGSGQHRSSWGTFSDQSQWPSQSSNGATRLELKISSTAWMVSFSEENQ